MLQNSLMQKASSHETPASISNGLECSTVACRQTTGELLFLMSLMLYVKPRLSITVH